MDNYIVSARKYRPSTFASVVGQQALTATLKNAIATNRLAHAYLFCGSRGVGKTSCARIFAKTINCTNPTPDGEACNECDSCRSFNEGASLNIIELDAASNNGVDDVRELVSQVQIPPATGRYRVFIIDEVHMLSAAAFNAFLKTLEEPPSYVIFVLATTEKHKIIPTILSRCQIYDFNRITIADMIEHLEYVAAQEGITTERPALNVIARKADGAMRDALSIFDQVASSCRGNITYKGTIENLNILDSGYYSRLLKAFTDGDVPTALLTYKEIRDKGFDSQFFLDGLSDYLRDLMVARDPSTLPLLDTDSETAAIMARDAASLPPDFYYKAMSLCNSANMSYRQATNKTFLVELLLIKLCQLNSPSPNFEDGNGEGQLKKIAVSHRAAEAQPAMPSSQAATQSTTPSTPSTPSTPAPQPTPVHPGVVATPAVQAPRPAAPKRQPPRRPMSAGTHLSFSDVISGRAPLPGQENSRSAASAAVEQAAKENEPYTAEAVTERWEAYRAARPSEHLLNNDMRASVPMHTDGDMFVITVENELQHERIAERLHDIRSTIRRELHNDNIDFAIRVNAGAGKKTTWTDREIITDLRENNEAIAMLISKFGLTLE